MKRILSFCLAFFVFLSSFILQVCANNSQVLLNSVAPTFDETYAVAYNDFENITGSFANGFEVVDTETEYGKAFCVPALSSYAIPGDSISATYTWNDNTYTVFNEGLANGKKYILSYDVKSFRTDSSKSQAFNLAPRHQTFWYDNGTTNGGYINTPTYNTDGSWKTIRLGFVASKTVADVRVNTWAKNVKSYIDNYLLMEAAEIILNDERAVANLDSLSDNVVVTPVAVDSAINSYMVSKGESLSFKVDAPATATVSVMNGETPISPDDDGLYTVNMVTNDITVNVTVDESAVPTFDSTYAVAYNDFENVTGTFESGFEIVDSGSSYGKVFCVPALDSYATPGNNITATYPWNNNTLTVFNETLVTGKKYILSYDTRSFPTAASKSKAFTLSPRHQTFWYDNGTDSGGYKNEPVYNADGSWKTVRLGFVASKDKADVRVNTWKYNVKSYIDNYLLMEAAEIVLNDEFAVAQLESLSDSVAITPVAVDSMVNSYMVAKGDALSFKINAPVAATVTVMNGETEVIPDNDGFYTVDKVTNDIVVNVDVDESALPKFDRTYAVAYNDFENVTGVFDGNGNTDVAYEIVDSDSSYGKVFCVPAYKGYIVPGDNVTATYSWNKGTYTVFQEPLVVGKKYVLSYDTKSFPTGTSKVKAFNLAPRHQTFWYDNGGRDGYKNEPAYNTDGSWQTVRLGFVASKNKADVRINTWAFNVKSYIDNYLIMEAAEIVLNDEYGIVQLSSLSDNVAVTPVAVGSFENSYMVAKGEKVSFKIDAPDLATITVMNGETEIFADNNGIYTVDKALNDITVNVNVEQSDVIDALETNALTNNGDIYIPYGRTAYSFADDLAKKNNFFNTDTIVVKNGEQNRVINEKISSGDKFYVKCGEISTDEYNVKIAGDASGDGNISVTDIIDIVDRIVDDKGTDNFYGLYDFDANGKISVSDIVNIRNSILGNVIDTRDGEADIIVASGVDIDFRQLDNGVYNAGNMAALANVIRKAMNGEEVILSVFGGSITAESGCNASPDDETQTLDEPSGIVTTLGEDSYADVMLRWFEETFSKYGATFKLINAGIGATDTSLSIHRMYEDVVYAIPDKKPDMVIYEWACNDGQFLYKQATFENGIRKFIEEDIAVLIFCFDMRNHSGGQAKQEPIADFYDLPLLSYYDALGQLPVYPWLTNDTVHPNRVGHALAGTIITRYLGNLYNVIANIGTEVPALPEETYHPEANYYGETYTARLTDIVANKYEDIRIVDFGSFKYDDSKEFNYNNNAYLDPNFEGKVVSCSRKYKSYVAMQNATGVYKPMIIEADNVRTASILQIRLSAVANCRYKVKVDGVEVEDPYNSFTCSKEDASDNIQIESTSHWASGRICYNPTPKKVTIEILPDLGATGDSTKQRYIRLFGLLLSK